VLTFLQGLPALISLISEVISGVKALAQLIQENKDAAWMVNSQAFFKQLREAKSADERKKAASDLAHLISGL
jgi:hypothetical protein